MAHGLLEMRLKVKDAHHANMQECITYLEGVCVDSADKHDAQATETNSHKGAHRDFHDKHLELAGRVARSLFSLACPSGQ